MKSKIIGFAVLVICGLALLFAFRLAIRFVFGIAVLALAVWVVRKITHNGRQS